MLLDFDRVEKENVETGMLFSAGDIGAFKTRPCNAWLERRQFNTRLVERRFEADFRRHEKEPGLALCGFDSNPARRNLATAGFWRVIDSGLDGRASNFDTIGFHTFPNPHTPEELWADLDEEQEARRIEAMAKGNPGYANLGYDDCGRYDLAGQSVAVPFVGATAASLVIAEAVRMLHDGPAYTDIKLGLGRPAGLSAQKRAPYSVSDLAGLSYAGAVPLPQGRCGVFEQVGL